MAEEYYKLDYSDINTVRDDGGIVKRYIYSVCSFLKEEDYDKWLKLFDVVIGSQSILIRFSYNTKESAARIKYDNEQGFKHLNDMRSASLLNLMFSNQGNVYCPNKLAFDDTYMALTEENYVGNKRFSFWMKVRQIKEKEGEIEARTFSENTFGSSFNVDDFIKVYTYKQSHPIPSSLLEECLTIDEYIESHKVNIITVPLKDTIGLFYEDSDFIMDLGNNENKYFYLTKNNKALVYYLPYALKDKNKNDILSPYGNKLLSKQYIIKSTTNISEIKFLGKTSERPSNVDNGFEYYNTETNSDEIYMDGKWINKTFSIGKCKRPLFYSNGSLKDAYGNKDVVLYGKLKDRPNIEDCAVGTIYIATDIIPTGGVRAGMPIFANQYYWEDIYGNVVEDNLISVPLNSVNSELPSLPNQEIYKGHTFFDIDKNEYKVNTVSGWKTLQTINSGNSASRPTVTSVGYQYFDTDLHKMIVWDGSSWINMDGTALADTTSNE